MSKTKELMIEIQALAHDMGDDFGEDAETIKIISRVLAVPVEFVQEALSVEFSGLGA